MKKEKEDLQIDGEFSPISLKKWVAHEGLDSAEYEPIHSNPMVLIDGTGQGIAFDDPNTMVMSSEDRLEQAKFIRESFQGAQIPAYLFRYLRYVFKLGKFEDYPTNESVVEASAAGKLTVESVDYKQVRNLIKYSDSNKEAAQLIGFISLFAGTVLMAKKQNLGIRLLIDKPETDLHPQRESMFMSMLYKLQAEYGLKPFKD